MNGRRNIHASELYPLTHTAGEAFKRAQERYDSSSEVRAYVEADCESTLRLRGFRNPKVEVRVQLTSYTIVGGTTDI